MRKPKKFKRFDRGGLTDGIPRSVDDSSIMSDAEYAKQREQGAKNWESIKNFFGGRRSADEPSAPIEERQPPKVEKETKAEPAKAEPAKTERINKPSFTTTDTTPKERGETDFNYEPQRPHNQALEDAKEQGRRAAAAFKPAAAKSAGPKPEKDVKYSGEAINVSSGASGFKSPDKSPAKAPRAASPEDIPGTDVKTPYKGETIDNSNLAAKQFAQSTLGATAVGRGLGSGIRGAMGLGRMFESAAKPEGKGTGKFPESKSVEVSNKPAVDRVKDAKIEGPPKPPRQETPVRETSAMEKSRKANEVGPPDLGARARQVAKDEAKGPPAPPKPKTPAEQMGLRETSAMEKSRKANEVGPPDLGARARRVAEDAAKDQKQAEGVMAAANQRARQTRAEHKQASDVMAAAKKRADVNRAQRRSDLIPAKEREPGMLQEYISGRDAARTRARDLPDDGLSTTRYANKKGGKIPAFKKGGLVGRGDGCAQRGKTKGRMV